MPRNPGHDSPATRCQSKVSHTRDSAIEEAIRLGFPVAPYQCPNGGDHWHTGNSQKNGRLFHINRTRWETLHGISLVGNQPEGTGNTELECE